MRLIIILIGLNLICSYGCHPFEFEKDEKFYRDIYRNNSNSTITLMFKNDDGESIDSITINIDNEDVFFTRNLVGDDPISKYLNSLNSRDINKIELSVNNQLVRQWIAEDNDGHNPFNPDSWTIEAPYVHDDGVRSEAIVFTITNDDLE